ncbi:MAG TPA: hypothetical protein VM286_00210 [Candidatus Thermoplasmatota archaeon]|nr:hypothetical protein [Candidatus Thermoplasmatota archaeon]
MRPAPPRPALAVLLATLLLAGCASPPDASPATQDARAQPFTWRTTSREGAAAGADAPYVIGIAGQADSFHVPASNATWLNITVTGTLPAELTVRYVEPGCKATSCYHNVPVQGTSARFLVKEPPTGDWTVAFYSADVPFAGTYRLEIASRVPPAQQQEA